MPHCVVGSSVSTGHPCLCNHGPNQGTYLDDSRPKRPKFAALIGPLSWIRFAGLGGDPFQTHDPRYPSRSARVGYALDAARQDLPIPDATKSHGFAPGPLQS